MKSKRRDNRKPGRTMANYLKRLQDAQAVEFDCLLFRAEESADEIIVPGEDVLGTIESNERAVTYADPVLARARKVTESRSDKKMNASVVLVLNVADVPSHSVVQYIEQVAGGTVREVGVYVVMSEPMGDAPGAGLLRHYCINCQGFLDKSKKEDQCMCKTDDNEADDKETDYEVLLEMRISELEQAQSIAKKLVMALLRNMAATSKEYNIPFEKLAADGAKNNPGMGTAEETIALAKEEGLI